MCSLFSWPQESCCCQDLCLRRLHSRLLMGYSELIGASLSEPHTRELGAEFSVRMFACMYPSDFARELQVKMFACPCQNNC